MNYTLPKWIHSIYPEPVISTASLTYTYLNTDEHLKQINMGYLLKKILDDTKLKIYGAEEMKKRKMILYSGHESTLGLLMDGLNVLVPHVPPYSSIIFVEVRKNQAGKYLLKVSTEI